MLERATVFGGRAAEYDRFRPGYPPEVISMIVAGEPDGVVDVGCGTGKAARLVAARGACVTGVEPDPRMAAVARAHGVDVVVSSLEDWQPRPCDVMYAAESWHWVDPRRGAEVAGTAVRRGGRWLAFWNVEGDETILDACGEVYRREAPGLVEDLAARAADDDRFATTVAEALGSTSCFGPMTTVDFPWFDRLPAEHFVHRLGTHSAIQVLPPRVRDRVRDGLLEALGGAGRVLEVQYQTKVFTADRR